MNPALVEQHCRALPKGTPPLFGSVLEDLRAQLDPAWRIDSGPSLTRLFESEDYPSLVALTAGIGELAQAEDHHPDLELGYGKLQVSLSTHSIGGLSPNDFILAAKIDRLAGTASGVR